MVVMVCCECNWGLPGVEKLPPHIHIRQGLCESPSGEKGWITGAIVPEQREVITISQPWTRGALLALGGHEPEPPYLDDPDYDPEGVGDDTVREET